MKSVKIYLADDHAMFRKALINMIKLHSVPCEILEAANGRELLMLMEREIPDIAIIDLEMPVMNGLKTIVRLKQSYPEVKVIVLSLYNEAEDARRVLSLGALGFISKCMMPEELMAAICLIATGGKYCNSTMVQAVDGIVISDHESGIHSIRVELSEREYAIVELVCREFTNRQIGFELSLSENTIRNHKVRIMRRSGVKNTSGLVKLAYQNAFSVRKR